MQTCRQTTYLVSIGLSNLARSRDAVTMTSPHGLAQYSSAPAPPYAMSHPCPRHTRLLVTPISSSHVSSSHQSPRHTRVLVTPVSSSHVSSSHPSPRRTSPRHTRLLVTPVSSSHVSSSHPCPRHTHLLVARLLVTPVSSSHLSPRHTRLLVAPVSSSHTSPRHTRVLELTGIDRLLMTCYWCSIVAIDLSRTHIVVSLLVPFPR